MLGKLICTGALLLGSWVQAIAAPVLSVNPSSSSVTVGNSFTLDIFITDAFDLFAWQLDLDFGPPGLANASAPTVGNFLGSPGDQTFGVISVDNTTGHISTLFSALSGAPGVTGDGVLAHVSFLAMLQGTFTVSLSNLMLVDSNLDDIFTSNPLVATVDITNSGGGNVPEPSSILLLALGLTSFAFLSRRCQAKGWVVPWPQYCLVKRLM